MPRHFQGPDRQQQGQRGISPVVGDGVLCVCGQIVGFRAAGLALCLSLLLSGVSSSGGLGLRRSFGVGLGRDCHIALDGGLIGLVAGENRQTCEGKHNSCRNADDAPERAGAAGDACLGEI